MKSNKKKKVLIGSSVVLITTGVGLLLLNDHQNDEIKDMQSEKVNYAENNSFIKQKGNYSLSAKDDSEVSISNMNDYDSVSIPSITQLEKANKSKNKDKVLKNAVGQINIPKLHLKLNILKGTNQTNMMYGATTMLPNQQMGKGNYVLAGHNMKHKGILFSDLILNDKPQVKKGDVIYLTDGTHKYKYEVFSTKTVHKTNTDCLNDSKDPILTLFTCTKDDGSGTTPYRFVVQAKLVD